VSEISFKLSYTIVLYIHNKSLEKKKDTALTYLAATITYYKRLSDETTMPSTHLNNMSCLQFAFIIQILLPHLIHRWQESSLSASSANML